MEMVAYNFQSQFCPAVRSGEKLQTIRAMRKGRSRHAIAGETLQLYTGMRTKNCKKLISDPTCLGIRQIEIHRADLVRIDGLLVDPKEIDQMAIADGFADRNGFVEFFEKVYGLPFEGVIISWGLERTDNESD